MSFNVDQFVPSIGSRGQKGSAIDYSGGDVILTNTVKGVVVTAAGNVVYRPRNEAAGSITITGAAAGYVLPHIPGLIVQTGTTASLATIED